MEHTDLSAYMFDAAPVVMFVLDPHGRVTRWNQAASALTGLLPKDILGQPFPERLLFPEDVEPWRQELGRVLAGLAPAPAEYRWRTWDGFSRALTCAGAPVRDASGEIACVVLTATEKLSTPPAAAGSSSLSRDFIRERTGERRDISRFLHDTIAQDLVALAFSIGKPQAAIDHSNPLDAAATLDLIDRCCNYVRVISYLLVPPPQGQEGLRAAIDWYVDLLREDAGLTISVEAEAGVENISPESESLVLGAIQEWTTRTILKRANTCLFIGLRNSASGVVLELKSVPCATCAGVSGDAPMADGWTTIRTQVRALGGRFQITSDAAGTVVRMSLPEAKGLGARRQASSGG